MTLIDFKSDPTYKAKLAPEMIDVPAMLFVVVDGAGSPEASSQGESEFQTAVQILYGLVYTIKFWDKKYPPPKDYAKFTVAPLEGLWWMTNGGDFDQARPADWHWTLMLRLPEFVTPEYFSQVVTELVARKQTDIFKKARLEHRHEGVCVQILHIGPYDQEAPTIANLRQFAKDNGYEPSGKHHELYFGDPRRTKPEKLRTILRQPVHKPQL